MLKVILYTAFAFAYAILFVEYAQQPVLRLLAGRPDLPTQLIEFLFFLPTLISGAFAIDAYNKMERARTEIFHSSPKSAFGQLWTGEMSMWRAFFGYHILLTVIFSIVANRAISQSLLLLILFPAVCVGYHVLTIVGTWRSSSHYTGSKKSVVFVRIGLIFSSIFTAAKLGLAVIANTGALQLN